MIKINPLILTIMMKTLLEKLLDAIIRLLILKLEELLNTDLNSDGIIGNTENDG
jgi:hypothetical protein